MSKSDCGGFDDRSINKSPAALDRTRRDDSRCDADRGGLRPSPYSGAAPTSLKVKVGTTVKWTNGDDIGHNVVANDGTFNSGLMKPGAAFTFTKPGTYEYVCSLHPEQMSGNKIEVSE